MLGGVANGRHNGCGGGQHQGAGAEDHQNGHRPDDLPRHRPGDGGSGQGDHHNPGGPPVRQAHNFGLARVGGLHQADHPLDGAVLPHPGGLHLKGAKLVYGAAGDRVPWSQVHREGLPGHHRLVDGGLPGEDGPIHGNGLSWQHPQAVPHLHLLRGQNGFLPLPKHPGGAGGELYQPFNARPGPGHGQVFQQAAQLHDEGHLPGGEVLPNDYRGNQGDGHQHVGLDVKFRHQADDGF